MNSNLEEYIDMLRDLALRANEEIGPPPPFAERDRLVDEACDRLREHIYGLEDFLDEIMNAIADKLNLEL